MKRGAKIFLFCLLSLTFIGCDRYTKSLAKNHLMNSQPLSYFHDTFRLEYAENTGAALSLGDNLSKPLTFVLLSAIPLLVVLTGFVYVLMNFKKFTLIQLLCFSMIIAGGLGNLIDRILFDRHVTDFMNMGIQNLRTGIFNIADLCITFGVVGLLFCYKSSNATGKPMSS
jgi:signal peptidase II